MTKWRRRSAAIWWRGARRARKCGGRRAEGSLTRLLKEYGNGNVFLALRSGYKDVMASLARQAMGAGELDDGADRLAASLA